MPVAIQRQWSSAVPTRNVVLTEHQARLLERLVASGRYQNASEVLREGLRLIETRDAEEKARIKVLREAAQVGVTDIEAGRFLSFRSPGALRRHLASVTGNALAKKRLPR
jgi:antitoxin ParD1/3/4